jgi:hypothetical protein
MKKLINYNKTVLAIIAGILFSGLILNTINQISPTPVLGVDQAGYIENDQEVEIANLDNTQIKEYILEESISTQALDTIFNQRVENVNNYLIKRNSPLAPYSEEIVKAANAYGIDYRLLAAISIIESSGGQHTFRPYNAWGWGKMTFANWTEAIWTVSEGLGNYYKRGMTTPRTIAPVYCPPNATNWANNVQSVMNTIGK